MVLRPKMDALETHVGGHKPLSVHLRFLKDVLYGLHVFATEDRCSSLQETLPKTTFSDTSQTPNLRAEIEVPKASKKNPKTLSWGLRKCLENSPETGLPKKSLFAPVTPRGEYWFRGLDLENGTTNIYIYIDVYMERAKTRPPDVRLTFSRVHWT